MDCINGAPCTGLTTRSNWYFVSCLRTLWRVNWTINLVTNGQPAPSPEPNPPHSMTLCQNISSVWSHRHSPKSKTLLLNFWFWCQSAWLSFATAVNNHSEGIHELRGRDTVLNSSLNRPQCKAATREVIYVVWLNSLSLTNYAFHMLKLSACEW